MSHQSEDSHFSNASTVCKQRSKFEIWAYEVSADVVRRTRPSTGPLAELYQNSQRVPGWLTDRESQYYNMFSSLYGKSMEELSATPSATVTTGEPLDESASQDLAHALHHIIHVLQRHTSLSLIDYHRSIYSETDLRQPLDRLAIHVWCTEVGVEQGYLFRSECAVKLPKTNCVRIQNAVIDSGTFLLNVPDGHEYRTAFFAAKELPGLICTVNKAPRLELAHWIVEYEKSEDQLKSVERQVYYGMVSSLWQRRALGYMDQFVFATAHVGQQLTVYAATWEEGTLKNPAPSRAGSDPGVTRGTSTRSTRSSTGSRRSPAPQGESDGPRPLLQSLNPQERQYKIVVYELAEYQTTKFYDMLHYYYLLRASRKLADEYREKIFQDKLPLFEERVKRLRRYDWPAKDNDNNTAEGSTRTGMPSLPEEPGPSGTQHAICVADPEEEASWKSEWDRERTKAFETCGFGSLTDFKIPECEMEADLDDGLYLE